jgi:hypothetical protein
MRASRLLVHKIFLSNSVLPIRILHVRARLGSSKRLNPREANRRDKSKAGSPSGCRPLKSLWSLVERGTVRHH